MKINDYKDFVSEVTSEESNNVDAFKRRIDELDETVRGEGGFGSTNE